VLLLCCIEVALCICVWGEYPDTTNDEPSDVAFKIRRGQYFWHARAAIGQIAARAVTQRVHVSEHTLRCIRASPNMQDDLAFPLRTLRVFKFPWASSLCL